MQQLAMFQKIVLLVAISVCFGLGVYFRYFRRPPTDDILAANSAASAAAGDAALLGQAAVGEDYDEDEEDDPVKISQRAWDRWIRLNRFVSIGKLFDKCEGIDRVMVGRVVMLKDPKGGVTSKTYLNVTLDKDVTGGLMYLTCQYNGNDLYSSHWDLCTADSDQDNRVIFCPIKAGRRKFIKELKIPNYLPKGHYSTKAWLQDQTGKSIGCAFADFTL